jgi:type I restriction enzyme M protein
VGNNNNNGEQSLKKAWAAFETEGREFWQQMDELVEMLDGLVAGEVEHE